MGGISGAIGDATGLGGKGGFGAPQQSGGQPQMGFGFNPNTDMPFSGQQPVDVLQSATNMIGGSPLGFGAGMQQPSPQPMPTSGMGGGKGNIMGYTPSTTDIQIGPNGEQLGSSVKGGPIYGPQIGFGFNPNTGGQTPQDTFNQYANNVFGGGNSIYQPNFMPQGPQIGFGPAPIEQNPMQPAPQPVNRFAPPNAPGVRQQPRTAPRAGIPVQSARTVQPNRFTRNRTR